MALRSLAQLQEQQAVLTAELMAASGAPATVSAIAPEAPAVPVVWIVRVDEVVTADEHLGAHLVVVRQQLTGTPPTPSDAETTSTVAYPMPDTSVTVFSVDDHALVQLVAGALIATQVG